MRVLFSSTRGAGHLQPLLRYAKAVLTRGHEVLVAGPEELREVLGAAALAHAPFDHPGDQALAPFWASLRAVPMEQQSAIVVRDIFAGANARAAMPGLLKIIRAFQPQLVVRESAEFGAIVAAEVAGVPHVRVAVHHQLMEEQICALAVAPIDSLREAAGLSADHGASLRAEPIFTAFPECFEGPPVSAASVVHRIGPGAPKPAAETSGFQLANDGLPLVYITFGTVLSTVPEALALYRTAVAAIAELPVRALLTTGRDFDVGKLGAIPANLRVEAWVPQAEVFPHTAVMVCHGGSGTVLGGLAAGIPQVVVPFGADQPQNAQSVAAIGAGVALTKPDPEALRAAIQRVLDDSGFRRAARAVAVDMAALPAVDDVVGALLGFAAR
jgi:UDP:flavonoid glycosyltransferase YjiC (YdhE family)